MYADISSSPKVTFNIALTVKRLGVVNTENNRHGKFLASLSTANQYSEVKQ